MTKPAGVSEPADGGVDAPGHVRLAHPRRGDDEGDGFLKEMFGAKQFRRAFNVEEPVNIQAETRCEQAIHAGQRHGGGENWVGAGGLWRRETRGR
ncbi:MAG TPA: hypothetical protein VHR66_23530 [Gemmataceae bacterium]|nr:hypothetical protein [Gemmataceae bacterium]